MSRARVTAAVLLAVVVAAPAAGHGFAPAFTLVGARLDSIFEPTRTDKLPNAHYQLTMTVRNDGAEPRSDHLSVDEYWVVFDLPFTMWRERVTLDPGESRTLVVDLDYYGFITLTPGPFWWFCMREDSTFELAKRCWSVILGAPTPDGAYPEDVPHWQLLDVPMGDTP